MEQIAKKLQEETQRLVAVIGTPVLSKAGYRIGKVKRVHVDPSSFVFSGLTVGRGVLKKAVYIGAEHVSRISSDAVFLSIDPVTELKGKTVITPEGKVVGKVVGIDRKGTSNELTAIRVGKLLRRSTVVETKHIRSIGTTVVLDHEI